MSKRLSHLYTPTDMIFYVNFSRLWDRVSELWKEETGEELKEYDVWRITGIARPTIEQFTRPEGAKVGYLSKAVPQLADWFAYALNEPVNWQDYVEAIDKSGQEEDEEEGNGGASQHLNTTHSEKKVVNL